MKRWRRFELECDKIWRDIIRNAWLNHCALCPAQADTIHHIIKRRFKAVRHEFMNGLPLCINCHNKVEQKATFDYLLPRWKKHHEWATSDETAYKMFTPIQSLSVHYAITMTNLKKLAEKF